MNELVKKYMADMLQAISEIEMAQNRGQAEITVHLLKLKILKC